MNFEKKNLLIPRPVPNDAESLWERTDNFVPAIPTAFEQEPELTIFVEENEVEQVVIDEPALLTIVPDCQIRYKETESEMVTLSRLPGSRRPAGSSSSSSFTIR